MYQGRGDACWRPYAFLARQRSGSPPGMVCFRRPNPTRALEEIRADIPELEKGATEIFGWESRERRRIMTSRPDAGRGGDACVALQTHKRRSIRLPQFDYSRQGAYFVTICTRDRVCLFGDIVDGEMRLNDFGKAAHEVWEQIVTHFPLVETDAWIVMPNHVHGVIFIAEPDTGASPNAGGTVGVEVAPQRPSGPEAFPWCNRRLLQIRCVETNQRIGTNPQCVGLATKLLRPRHSGYHGAEPHSRIHCAESGTLGGRIRKIHNGHGRMSEGRDCRPPTPHGRRMRRPYIGHPVEPWLVCRGDACVAHASDTPSTRWRVGATHASPMHRTPRRPVVGA